VLFTSRPLFAVFASGVRAAAFPPPPRRSGHVPYSRHTRRVLPPYARLGRVGPREPDWQSRRGSAMNRRVSNVRSSSLSNSRRPADEADAHHQPSSPQLRRPAYGVTGSVVRRQRRDTSHLPVRGAVAWELTRGPCALRALGPRGRRDLGRRRCGRDAGPERHAAERAPALEPAGLMWSGCGRSARARGVGVRVAVRGSQFWGRKFWACCPCGREILDISRDGS
jgi:hypothetical protein